jgi:general secretion pathway protein I
VKNQQGFTLVEVLVALAIVAIAFTALIRVVGFSADTTAILQDRSLALWVAQNRMARHQLDRVWPAIGTREGTDEMADQKWYWKEKITASIHKDIRQIDIEVGDAETKHVLASLVGAVRRPNQNPGP